MPHAPGAPPPVKHAAVATVVPATQPPVFVASCMAGDFTSKQSATSKDTALAAQDMKDHLASV